MAKKIPSFNYSLCVACGICMQACPVSAIDLTKVDFDRIKRAYPQLTDRQCIGCSQCEKACPMDSVQMVEL